ARSSSKPMFPPCGTMKEPHMGSSHPSRTIAEGQAFMHFIGGRSCDALSGERIDVVSPSDGLRFASIPSSGSADVDLAVRAARQAFDEGPWSRMPSVERGRLLSRLSLQVARHAEE